MYYSQEARYSSLLVSVTLLLINNILSYIEGKRKYIYILIYLSMTLLCYTHYMGFFFANFFILILLSKYALRENQKFYICLFLANLTFSPWLLVFKRQVNQWAILREYNTDPNIFIYFKNFYNYAFSYKLYWDTFFDYHLHFDIFALFLGAILIILSIKKKYFDKKIFYEKIFIYAVPLCYILFSKYVYDLILNIKLRNFLY